MFVKPARLRRGDRIAIISPSWGGPAAQPLRYARAREVLQTHFGLDVVEMPNALADGKWLARNAAARAADLHVALHDRTVRAVFTSIGGDDAIELMPHVDVGLIAANAKIFLGFSDATVLHFAHLKAGVTSFYGPNVLPGLAEDGGPFAYTLEALEALLFKAAPVGRIEPNARGWTAEPIDWSSPEIGPARRLNESLGPRTLAGRGTAAGPLIGGCTEVLAALIGTAWWPATEAWRGAIVFIETYDAAQPAHVVGLLAKFAEHGILNIINGIIVGRPGGGADVLAHRAYEAVIRSALGAAARTDLPVIANLDFGHTDPVFTLPYGVVAEIDCVNSTLTFSEPAVRG